VNVVWVGLNDTEKRLARLQARCEELISPLGFPPEGRGFTPHLTIARNKDPRRSNDIRSAVALQGEPDFGVQCVEEVVFYQSTPGPSGHVHQALSKHRFSEPRP
jgi:2'-5' RNA ligase